MRHSKSAAFFPMIFSLFGSELNIFHVFLFTFQVNQTFIPFKLRQKWSTKIENMRFEQWNLYGNLSVFIWLIKPLRKKLRRRGEGEGERRKISIWKAFPLFRLNIECGLPEHHFAWAVFISIFRFICHCYFHSFQFIYFFIQNILPCINICY